MNCQRCGAEIKVGEVFCYECGEDVQLVPDYDPLDTITHQKKALEEQKRREEEERARRAEKEAERKKKRKRKRILITVFSLLFIVFVTVGAIFFIKYKQDNSFEYQYAKAYEAYQIDDFITAGTFGKKALELEPANDNAILLMAEVNYHLNNIDLSVELFKSYVLKHPDSVDAYGRLITIYQENNRLEDIYLLMSECDNDVVLTQYADFVPSEITFVTVPGTYNKKEYVELSYMQGTVYYTLDGVDPTMEAELYIGPVQLQEGKTTFKAINYSNAGIPGAVVSAEYNVILARPNPPFISPESGDYDEGTEITVIVPDGCVAYYSFEGVADRNCQKYTGPIVLEKGEHVFSVILVDENDKESFPSSETYVVNE